MVKRTDDARKLVPTHTRVVIFFGNQPLCARVCKRSAAEPNGKLFSNYAAFLYEIHAAGGQHLPVNKLRLSVVRFRTVFWQKPVD